MKPPSEHEGWRWLQEARNDVVPRYRVILVFGRRFIPAGGVALDRHISLICLTRAPCRPGDSTPSFHKPRVVAGQPMPGIFVVHDRMAVRQALQELLLLDTCSEQDEWKELVACVPLP